MPLPSLAYALGGLLILLVFALAILKHGPMVRKIRMNYSDTVLPAAALSVYAGSDHRLRAIESDFQEHLVTPVEPALLAVTLARLVRRG
jgi:CheY-like chemotaxis protein